MKPIPKPEGADTWIETFGDADLEDTKALRELDYSCSELRLLLDVLRAADGYDGDPDAYDHVMNEALCNVSKCAPHLIDAARKARP